MRKRQVATLTILALVLVTAGWWFFLWSPKKAALATATKTLETARQEQRTLETQLSRLKDLERNKDKLDLRMAQIANWIPDEPNLPQFINAATNISKEAGIDFLSISPGLPAAGAAGQGVISLNIQITGGFFQLLDYLVRVEKLPRSVVVDTLSVAPSQDEKTGTTKLTVSVTARMFTSSVPQYTSVPPGFAAPVAPLTATAAGSATGTAPGSNAQTSVPSAPRS